MWGWGVFPSTAKQLFTDISDEAVQSPTLFTFRDERKTAAGEVGGMGSVFAFAVMFVQRQLPLTI